MAMQNIYNYQKPRVMPKQTDNFNKQPKLNVNRNISETKTNNYLEQKVMSAKPEELTMMLYDGMVKFIKQAMLYNEQKNVEKTNHSIQRAEAIITELNVTLDMSIDVSENLELMYDYMTRRLRDANIEKDNGVLQEVLGFAEELRDTWKQVMQMVR